MKRFQFLLLNKCSKIFRVCLVGGLYHEIHTNSMNVEIIFLHKSFVFCYKTDIHVLHSRSMNSIAFCVFLFLIIP